MSLKGIVLFLALSRCPLHPQPPLPLRPGHHKASNLLPPHTTHYSSFISVSTIKYADIKLLRQGRTYFNPQFHHCWEVTAAGACGTAGHSTYAAESREEGRYAGLLVLSSVTALPYSSKPISSKFCLGSRAAHSGLVFQCS